MRVLPRLTKSRSSSSASQQALPSRSVGRRRNPVLTAVGFLLLGQACFSEWRLMASFPGCSSILPYLLPFLLSIPLVLPSLTGAASGSERLSLLRSGLALQQPGCAIRGQFCQRNPHTDDLDHA